MVRFHRGSLLSSANPQITFNVASGEALSEALTRQDRIELRGGLGLERREYMRIRVERQADLRMPERLHDRPRIDALGQQERGGRVPQIVEANVGQLGGL